MAADFYDAGNIAQALDEARTAADVAEDIRAMHARDCAVSGDASAALVAAAARAERCEAHAERLQERAREIFGR